MAKKLLLSIVLTGLIGQSIQAFIIQRKTWVKTHSNGTQQYVYCLSDCHHDLLCLDKMHEQREHLFNYLDTCDRKKTKIIVEDAASAAQNSLYTDAEGFLSFFANKCQQKNLDVINVDICRRDIAEFINLKLVTHQLDQIEKGIIPSYVDPNIAKERLQNILLKLDQTTTLEKALQTLTNGTHLQQKQETIKTNSWYRFLLNNESIAKLLENNANSGISQLITRATVLLPFVDYEALNKLVDIAQDKKIETVFVIMGANHIDKLEAHLLELEYKLIFSEGSIFSDESIKLREEEKDFINKINWNEIAQGSVDAKKIVDEYCRGEMDIKIAKLSRNMLASQPIDMSNLK